MDKNAYKPYTAKRWTEIPVPEVTGHVEFTEEESRENDKKAEDILRAYGIIGVNEHVKDGETVKDE